MYSVQTRSTQQQHVQSNGVQKERTAPIAQAECSDTDFESSRSINNHVQNDIQNQRQYGRPVSKTGNGVVAPKGKGKSYFIF